MRIANIQLALVFTAEKCILPEAFGETSQVKSTTMPLFSHPFKDEVKSGEWGIALETDNGKAEGLNSD